MATYKSFEDLPVWKNAKDLAVLIYQVAFRTQINEDYDLKRQILKAAISISSNIAEGFERGTKREFIQFLYIARGSCGELRSQLFIANDVGYPDEKNFRAVYSRNRKVSKQISGFIEYLKATTMTGQKFLNQKTIKSRII